jgi:hypothetical protein
MDSPSVRRDIGSFMTWQSGLTDVYVSLQSTMKMRIRVPKSAALQQINASTPTRRIRVKAIPQARVYSRHEDGKLRVSRRTGAPKLKPGPKIRYGGERLNFVPGQILRAAINDLIVRVRKELGENITQSQILRWGAEDFIDRMRKELDKVTKESQKSKDSLRDSLVWRL